MLAQLLPLQQALDLEILVVDDDSADGTAELVRQLARREPRLRLIRRVGRAGLASAIKEGLLDASGDLAVVMDSDAQHEPAAASGPRLPTGGALGPGDRQPLPSPSRDQRSQRPAHGGLHLGQWRRAPQPAARLSGPHRSLSGFFALRLDVVLPLLRAVDVNGFTLLYELLAVSQGRLRVTEVSLTFQPRTQGHSKLDLAVFWDFLISILHSLSFRLLPRRAISFALVGLSGVVVQLGICQGLMALGGGPSPRRCRWPGWGPPAPMT